jgi:GTP-binding protein
MPGYGYAAVGKEKVASWGRLLKDYLRGRASLRRALLLVDSRHGLKDSDRRMMALMDEAAVSYAVVLTKADEIKAADAGSRVAAVESALSARAAAYPQVFLTSSRHGDGVSALRAFIAQTLQETSPAR